ncbi:MAG: PH domain-containing protein [Rickettsiales bacterium]|nr:PH domain-containing protein [Rickettsiales bacterium]
MSSYIENNLVGNERLIYMGKIHRYCYVPSIIIFIIGMMIAGWTPDMTSSVSNKMTEYEAVSEFRDDISQKVDNITGKVSDFASDIGISEHAFTLGEIVAELRKFYFGVILMFLSALALMRAYMDKLGTEHAVTTRKIISKTGLVSVDTKELSLERIEGIKVHQTMMDRMIGRGDLTISGIGLEQIDIKGLAKPSQFRIAALRTIERYKRTINPLEAQ